MLVTLALRVDSWHCLTMGIGTGIALFVIGAILAFALNVELAWLDLNLVGYILMGAGVVVFIISLILVARRRQRGVPPADTQL